MKLPDNVEPYKGPGNLNELYQASGLRFAFLSAPRDGSQLCHPWIKCKDYLHDMVRANYTKGTAHIYGLKYTYGASPTVDTRRIRMAITNKDKTTSQLQTLVHKGICIINMAERAMGIKSRTSVASYHGDTKMVIVNGPNVWLKSPVLTSLFPLLIRLGASPEFGKPIMTLDTVFEGLANAKKEGKGGKDAGFGDKLHGKLAAFFINYESLLLLDKNKVDPVIYEGNGITTYHNSAGCISYFTGGGLYKERKKALDVAVEKYKEQKDAFPLVAVNKHFPVDLMYYSPATPSFVFVRPGEGENYVGINTGTSCREYLTRDAAKAIRDKTIPTDKLRLLMRIEGVGENPVTAEKAEAHIFRTKRVINFIEKSYGIKRSTVRRVSMLGRNGVREFGWLWVGSPTWFTSPVMMNIYVTFVRCFNKYDLKYEQLSDEMSSKKLDKLIQDMLDKECWVKNAEGDVFRRFDTIKMFLGNWKKLFRTQDVADHYTLDHHNAATNFYYIGVSSVLKRTSKDVDLIEKIQTLKKE